VRKVSGKQLPCLRGAEKDQGSSEATTVHYEWIPGQILNELSGDLDFTQLFGGAEMKLLPGCGDPRWCTGQVGFTETSPAVTHWPCGRSLGAREAELFRGTLRICASGLLCLESVQAFAKWGL
jgi:hypothetical protein